jgi:hypothetical protein
LDRQIVPLRAGAAVVGCVDGSNRGRLDCYQTPAATSRVL